MKKFISFMAVIAAALAISSCEFKSTTIEWDVDVNATANGNVVFKAPVGIATLKGDALCTLESEVKADSLLLASTPSVESVLAANGNYDKKTLAFAARVAEESESAWGVISAEGEYQIDVTGFVREPNTGIILAVDFHFPKTPNEEVVDLGAPAVADTTVVK